MPELGTVETQKAELRSRLEAARAALAPALVAERSARAASHLIDAIPARVATVALYAGRRNELDPRAAVASLKDRGLRVVYPRAVRGEPLRFADGEPRVRSTFGVLEPAVDAAPVELAAIDAFVVPGLGFTVEGDRLGFGGGFYDRTLAAHVSALRIGYAHEEQLVPTLPTTAHDERVDLIVTHEKIRACTPRSHALPGAQP